MTNLMHLSSRFLLLALLAAHPAMTQAEMFLTARPLSSVLVGDHLQSGVGFQNSREIQPTPNFLTDPSRVQVYTGKHVGSDENVTEVVVCDEFRNKIFRYPIDADGAIDPPLFFSHVPDTLPCTEFLIYRDEIFIGGAGNAGISVYPNYTGGRHPEIRKLVDLFADLEIDFFSIRADGDYIYALDRENMVVRWRLFENEDRERISGEIVASNNNYCPNHWTSIEVQDNLLYVANDGSNGNGARICVFDMSVPEIDMFNAMPIRILVHDDFVAPTQLAISGDELFVVDLTNIFVFDLRAAGAAPEKRAIETGEIEYIWVTQESEPEAPTFELALEEPVNGAVHSGVGNIRGWAVANEGITKVEIYIDGLLFQSAPYGGNRDDVGAVFPEVTGSSTSGFSLAYNYGALDAGEHTLLARAQTRSGRILESSSTFNSIRPGQEFIPGDDAVDLSGAACSVNQGGSIRVEDMTIDGSGPWDVFLEWQPAAQAFEAQTYIFNADGI